MHCAQCGHDTSITAGTLFEDTRKPLRMWFRAMWWVSTQKAGFSAKAFMREMGLTSYQTAWTWLHKLRHAMVLAGRRRLSGRVEVDGTYVGGVETGADGRYTEKKALVVIAAEEDGKGIGRIRLGHVADASAASLVPFVLASVEPGSNLHTDGHWGYAPLVEKGYTRDISVVTPDPTRAAKLLPRVHRIAALLKRWLLGTHHGAVRNKHLQSYLDEFTFRFNRRTSGHPGKIFYRLAQQVVNTQRTTYRQMVDRQAGRFLNPQ
jgi:transposase-like protein